MNAVTMQNKFLDAFLPLLGSLLIDAAVIVTCFPFVAHEAVQMAIFGKDTVLQPV
jgi:hypothetical protein